MTTMPELKQMTWDKVTFEMQHGCLLMEFDTFWGENQAWGIIE